MPSTESNDSSVVTLVYGRRQWLPLSLRILFVTILVIPLLTSTLTWTAVASTADLWHNAFVLLVYLGVGAYVLVSCVIWLWPPEKIELRSDGLVVSRWFKPYFIGYDEMPPANVTRRFGTGEVLELETVHGPSVFFKGAFRTPGDFDRLSGALQAAVTRATAESGSTASDDPPSESANALR